MDVFGCFFFVLIISPVFFLCVNRWSAEFGNHKYGSPELYSMLAEYIYFESPELVHANFLCSFFPFLYRKPNNVTYAARYTTYLEI